MGPAGGLHRFRKVESYFPKIQIWPGTLQGYHALGNAVEYSATQGAQTL